MGAHGGGPTTGGPFDFVARGAASPLAEDDICNASSSAATQASRLGPRVRLRLADFYFSNCLAISFVSLFIARNASCCAVPAASNLSISRSVEVCSGEATNGNACETLTGALALSTSIMPPREPHGCQRALAPQQSCDREGGWRRP